MTDRAVLSVSTRKDLSERLDRLASVTQRTKSSLASQAIEEFVEQEERIIAQIQEGLADARAGRVVADEDVDAWVDALGSEHELPLPQSRKT